MFNFVRANLYKALQSKTFVVLMAVSTIASVAMIVLKNGIATGSLNASLTGISFLVSDASMLTLLGAILASAIIGGEFESKWFHHAIIAGYSRLQIVIGKLFTYVILFGLLTLPYLIGAIIVERFAIRVQTPTPGLGVLTIAESVTDESFGYLLVLLFVMFIVYVGQVSLTVLLAFTVKKPMLVIPIFSFISAMAGQVAANASAVPTLEKLLNSTPFGSQYIALSANVANRTLVEAVLFSALFVFIMAIGTYLSFRKAELK